MKKVRFLSILLVITALFMSCEEENNNQVNFDVTVTGESPNAIVQLTNTSDPADFYEWEFSEGAGVSTSEEENPQIVVDKVGEFTITLTAYSGDSETAKTKSINITGYNGIYSFKDVELGTSHYEDSIGNFFSCKLGSTYVEDDVNNYIGEKIDFVEKCNLKYGPSFFSPKNYLRPVPSGMVVKFNYNNDNTITVSEFDSMVDEQLFLNLHNATEYRCDLDFVDVQFPKVIYMQDENNLWGAIKVKSYTEEKVIVDVKKQKYITE